MSSTFIPKYQKQSKASISAEVKQTLKYFEIFFYAPTLREVWQFLPVHLQYKKFKIMVEKLVKKNEVCFKNNRLTLPEKKELVTKSIKKQKISIRKWQLLESYKPMLNKVPFVQFIGVSGSLAISNTNVNDDIDLFVITVKNRLFLARLFITLLTSFFGIRRSRGVSQAPNKLCFNLFFDESDLEVAKPKQSYFTAHEVLQLYPLINRNQTWEKFIQENRWVKNYFPNNKVTPEFIDHIMKEDRIANINKLLKLITDIFEQLARKTQLALINRHKTNEIITKKQLWFFPADFEKKVKNIF